MIVYKINISCVDGVTFYSCGADNLKQIKNFLEKYDHEGSSIGFEVWDVNFKAPGNPSLKLEEIDDSELGL